MKNKLLLGAVVLVVGASIAYAAFAQLITVSGTGTLSGDWDVSITSITRTSANGAVDAVDTPVIGDLNGPGTSATFNVDLAFPGAYAEYDIVVTNAGSIDADLATITGVTEANAAAPSYITYTLTGVAVNDTLLAGATDTATVRVTWESTGTDLTDGATKSATIGLNYVQST